MYKRILELENLSKQDLIEIHTNLNNYKWDKRLGEKPEEWDDMPDFILNEQYRLPTKSRIISPILREIETKVSEKQLMKHWHSIYRSRTSVKFEIWWMKRQFSKFFNIGFYNKKNQEKMRVMLESIAQNNKQDWLSKTYYPKTDISSK